MRVRNNQQKREPAPCHSLKLQASSGLRRASCHSYPSCNATPPTTYKSLRQTSGSKKSRLPRTSCFDAAPVLNLDFLPSWINKKQETQERGNRKNHFISRLLASHLRLHHYVHLLHLSAGAFGLILSTACLDSRLSKHAVSARWGAVKRRDLQAG